MGLGNWGQTAEIIAILIVIIANIVGMHCSCINRSKRERNEQEKGGD